MAFLSAFHPTILSYVTSLNNLGSGFTSSLNLLASFPVSVRSYFQAPLYIIANLTKVQLECPNKLEQKKELPAESLAL